MLIFGKNPVLYTLQNHSDLINEILLSKEIDQKLFKEFAKLGKKIVKLDNKKAQALAKGKNHQGMFLDIQEIPLLEVDDIFRYKKVLILLGISDVGNIGAIIRSAYCFGIDAVLISGVNSFSLEGAVRSSSGAALDIPVCLHKDVYDLLNRFRQNGFMVAALDMSGEKLGFQEGCEKFALILGAEGDGISQRVLKKCDKVFKIEQKRAFDSLNVSVAGAIFMDRMCNG